MKNAGVSIIINNIRYDSVETENKDVCNQCDLRPICKEDSFIKCHYGQGFIFKRYDKILKDDKRRIR